MPRLRFTFNFVCFIAIIVNINKTVETLNEICARFY